MELRVRSQLGGSTTDPCTHALVIHRHRLWAANKSLYKAASAPNGDETSLFKWHAAVSCKMRMFMTVTNRTTRFSKLLAVVNADGCTWHSIRDKKVILLWTFSIIKSANKIFQTADSNHGPCYSIQRLRIEVDHCIES